jgi:glycosyltransferase involved in cell wall biosynthesis
MMIAKGVFVLLEACAHLKERNIPFECHFVGDWLDITEASFHQKVKTLNLSNNVYAYGKKYGDEKNAFYQQSDIFVFPSFYDNEVFPLVLLEAMQFELPIIASYEGGIPDIVLDKETGFLIPKNDTEALAGQLITLLNNPSLRNKMGFEGKKRFEENFTLNKFEERLTNIINEFTDAA